MMKFTRTERKSIPVHTREWVQQGRLPGYDALPVVMQPAFDQVNLSAWIETNQHEISERLYKEGGILFRGFAIQGNDDFSNLLSVLSNDGLMEYKYKSTPRTHIGSNIYTSTEYPADQEIPMHNEMSYASSWPQKIAFYCHTAAPEGGATPIADSRKIYQYMPSDIRQQFEQKKVMYVRHYGVLDLKWQDVFQTTDKDEIAAFCERSGIQYEWLEDEGLKTWQVCDAVQQHPVTGEWVWFNQAHLFHVSALDADVRSNLLAMMPEDQLPRNACFGDGTPISDAIIHQINDVYKQHSVVFPWQDGDLLVLDNMLVAHGRKSYAGPRKILVGMY